MYPLLWVKVALEIDMDSQVVEEELNVDASEESDLIFTSAKLKLLLQVFNVALLLTEFIFEDSLVD